MKQVNPWLVAVVAMIGLMGIVFVGFVAKKFMDARALQERLSQPADYAPPETPEPADVEPPPPEPVDPAVLEAALSRFGPLDDWIASDDPCPQALPSMQAEVYRREPDAWGVREVVTPPSPVPIRIAADVEHALAKLSQPVTEPTLVLLRLELVEPTLDNRRLFTGGRTAGRAFLLVPFDDAIVCVGDYTATSSASVAADPSELELSQMENDLALFADLVLHERAAASESLRRAERTP